ncbi:MAG: YraN family protein [Planctomycetia bacterium]|nr:YraN family protein [Planctomycetia bacterium]
MGIWTNFKSWTREILIGIAQEMSDSGHHSENLSACTPKIVKNPGKYSKDILGRKGEELGTKYLMDLNYKILYQNIKFPSCEFDLIAEDPKTNEIVMVEIKTRRSDHFCAPEEEVDQRRVKKMVDAAYEYVRWSRQYNCNLRFDIISILWPDNKEPQINHLIGAIDPRSL